MKTKLSQTVSTYTITTLAAIILVGCKSNSPPVNPSPDSAQIPVPPIPPEQVQAHTPNQEKELIIRDLKVVNSPRATNPTGKWHIRTLFSNMGQSGSDPSAFVLRWLRTWETPQTINGFTVAARPNIRSIVIDPWVAASGQVGKPDDQVQLDWSKAPFRLLAIVCRTDLARINLNSVESAGEGRFVFGVLDSSGTALRFTVIFEYRLQADSFGKVRDWAKCWHNLGNLGDFDEAYLAELERITDSYSGRNIAPGLPNGNALNQLRTDEIALASPWELREFKLSSPSGNLLPDTVKVTPDLTFNGTATLAKFINDNEASILAKRHDVPLSFEGQPFLAGSSLNPFPQPVWNATGVNNAQARHLFALSTCNGCHGKDGHLTNFTHIAVRGPNDVAALSGFLTGTSFPDPAPPGVGTITINDLAERSTILQQLANIGPTAAAPSIIKRLQERRNRVH